MNSVTPPGPRGCVIIPAHNEAAVIGRTLAPLSAAAADGVLEVIVVANACTDGIDAVARGFAGVRVLESAIASKTAAMNAGDAAAAAWPRLYLDADIEIEPTAVIAVFDALSEPGILAARPPFVYDTAGAGSLVRRYFRARARIPVPVVLWGAGCYGINRIGHGRFAGFPDITADDVWTDELFDPAEKRIVDAPPVRVRTPLTTGDLLAVLTRQRRGPSEIGTPSRARERTAALLTTATEPAAALDAAAYFSLTALARWRASRQRRSGRRVWERDGSSRGALSEMPDV